MECRTPLCCLRRFRIRARLGQVTNCNPVVPADDLATSNALPDSAGGCNIGRGGTASSNLLGLLAARAGLAKRDSQATIAQRLFLGVPEGGTSRIDHGTSIACSCDGRGHGREVSFREIALITD